MNKYYISSLTGKSGIAQYSRDFYELVLKERGYQFVDSNRPLSSILSLISSRDKVHLEIGIFQKREQEVLFAMMRAQYKQLSVTLHDAPILKYPFVEFKQGWLNQLSKIADRIGGHQRKIKSHLEKLKAIYVLTKAGERSIKNKFDLTNVYYLPHIVNPDDLSIPERNSRNLVYFGFIGKNKGLDYALQLHQLLSREHPDVVFNVIGMPMGKEREYFEKLKLKYRHNVNFTGYLPESEVDALFSESACAILPFRSYRFFYPASGSILYSLKKGTVVLTNKVNAITETIENGKNGYFLTGDIGKDLSLLSTVLSDQHLRQQLLENAMNYLQKHHFPGIVKLSLHE